MNHIHSSCFFMNLFYSLYIFEVSFVSQLISHFVCVFSLYGAMLFFIFHLICRKQSFYSDNYSPLKIFKLSTFHQDI